MDTPTLELIEACRRDQEPTGIETPMYLSCMKDHEHHMAIEHVTREAGLTDAQMKFCFWLDQDMKRIERELFGRGRAARGKAWSIVETHNEWGDKLNHAGRDKFNDEDFTAECNAASGEDALAYVWGIVNRANGRAATWMELALRQADEVVRAQHASTKDAVRMRERRAAGKVKPRPPRPPRSLAQQVEDRRKMVDTRVAKMAEYEAHVKNHGAVSAFEYKSTTAKAWKSLRSAKKALETAEKRLAESLVKA